MKKTFIFFFILVLLVVFSGTALAECRSCQENTVKVYVNVEEIVFPDQKPFINPDNRTLVPARLVSEALGAQVEWDGLKRTVKINYEGKTILLEIGLKQALIGTSVVTLDTKADIVNDRTMVPLRFVSECLGAKVEWNGEAREVYITTEDAKPIKPFTGQLFNQAVDLPISDYLGYKIPFADEPEARVSYITVDELPAQVGRTIIYSLTVDDDYVHVKQRSLSSSEMPVDMHIKENGLLTRNRCFIDGQKGIYTYSYPLTLKGEIADGIGKADKTKIEAFAFDDINNNGSLDMLVIKNPLYEEGN